jgi:hypothetical protein
MNLLADRSQPELDDTLVITAGIASDQPALDEGVDEAAGTANLAHEQSAEFGQGERSMAGKNLDHLGLGRCQRGGAQAIRKYAAAMALRGQDQVPYLAGGSRSHTYPPSTVDSQSLFIEHR